VDTNTLDRPATLARRRTSLVDRVPAGAIVVVSALLGVTLEWVVLLQQAFSFTLG